MYNSQELGEVHSTSDLYLRNHLLCLSYRVNRANHDSASTVAAWFGYHTTLYVAFLRGLDAPQMEYSPADQPRRFLKNVGYNSTNLNAMYLLKRCINIFTICRCEFNYLFEICCLSKMSSG